jgi:hypothetical protein
MHNIGNNLIKIANNLEIETERPVTSQTVAPVVIWGTEQSWPMAAGARMVRVWAQLVSGSGFPDVELVAQESIDGKIWDNVEDGSGNLANLLGESITTVGDVKQNVYILDDIALGPLVRFGVQLGSTAAASQTYAKVTAWAQPIFGYMSATADGDSISAESISNTSYTALGQVVPTSNVDSCNLTGTVTFSGGTGPVEIALQGAISSTATDWATLDEYSTGGGGTGTYGFSLEVTNPPPYVRIAGKQSGTATGATATAKLLARATS